MTRFLPSIALLNPSEKTNKKYNQNKLVCTCTVCTSCIPKQCHQVCIFVSIQKPRDDTQRILLLNIGCLNAVDRDDLSSTGMYREMALFSLSSSSQKFVACLKKENNVHVNIDFLCLVFFTYP